MIFKNSLSATLPVRELVVTPWQ